MATAHPMAGDRRAIARLISRAEAADPSLAPTLRGLYAQGGHTPVIGVTGPPGAGKSTLVDQLIAHWRGQGLRVAILAVDPSSPITGGALLGDRVRMSRHNVDPGVFIRSMASRGRLGGLSAAAGDALTILDAAGFDRILVETVGTGQNEIDILLHAATVVILQTPAGGDAVQAMKAGMLEIGDIFVVNKADLPGADRTVSALRDSVEFRYHVAPPEIWVPPILKTRAAEGEGVAALDEALAAHLAHISAYPETEAKRQRQRLQGILVERLTETLRHRYYASATMPARLAAAITELQSRRTDPATAITQILAESGLA